MTQPQLTEKIEQKLIALIEQGEQISKQSLKPTVSAPYIQLADLYHFHKNFAAEAEVLTRFTLLDNADPQDMADIYERIERLARLLTLSEGHAKQKKPELSLLDEKKPEIKIRNKVAPRAISGKPPFKDKTHRVLTMCAAYTGRSDNDEIIQAAFVLTEYPQGGSGSPKIIKTYLASRIPLTKVPTETLMRFNLTASGKNAATFDSNRISQLFAEADFVVSHNDADVERKLLALLVPEVAAKPWYSSQKDIPWGAIGIKTRRLSELSSQLKLKTPRTCLERAHAISQILQQPEPFSEQAYIERLYNLQTMKPLVWTPELLNNQKRLKKQPVKTYKIVAGLFAAVAISLGIYYL